MNKSSKTQQLQTAFDLIAIKSAHLSLQEKSAAVPAVKAVAQNAGKMLPQIAKYLGGAVRGGVGHALGNPASLVGGVTSKAITSKAITSKPGGWLANLAQWAQGHEVGGRLGARGAESAIRALPGGNTVMSGLQTARRLAPVAAGVGAGGVAYGLGNVNGQQTGAVNAAAELAQRAHNMSFLQRAGFALNPDSLYQQLPPAVLQRIAQQRAQQGI